MSASSAATAQEAAADSRTLCYAARDAFYECMDKHDRQKATCKAEDAEYAKLCLKSWRKYWNERYAKDMRIRTPGEDRFFSS